MPFVVYRVNPEQVAYDEGRDAFLLSVPMTENPYDPRTRSFYSWVRGYITERTDAHDLIKEAGRELK